jgi:nitrile hydratase
MSSPHDHDHSHSHGSEPHPHGPFQPDDPDDGRYRRLAAALAELLIEKGAIEAEALRAHIERMDGITPALGARVVARAWSDPAFKTRLLADGSAAVSELGIDMMGVRLVVVENRPGLHNLIVCTLCSCYPRPLLGRPPSWYKSREYRSRAVREPRAVLAEFGLAIPEATELRVHDSTADMRYLVLPERPAGTEGLREEELAALVGRDAMVGTARAAPPNI